MKRFDKRILQAGFVLLIVICLSIVFYHVMFTGVDIFMHIKKICSILTPIFAGIFTGYLLNPVLVFFENKIVKPFFTKLFPKRNIKKTIYRGLSVFLTIAFSFLFIYAILIMVIPQLVTNINGLVASRDVLVQNITDYANKLIIDNPKLFEYVNTYAAEFNNFFTTSIVPALNKFAGSASEYILNGVVVALNVIINVIVAIIISIYVLINKELYCAQVKKLVYAFFKKDTANSLINNARYANNVFSGFLVGKVIDSVIIGLLCFIVVTIFKMPYTALISVIVGVTNIIPYFGPIIGAVPCFIIILLTNPIKSVYFLIIILIIQQIDGNIIGPKILGQSTGLSSFWVIFSITLFGGYFKVFGMFIGVPLFALIYAIIKTIINDKLKLKKMPADTGFYMENDFHDKPDPGFTINDGKELKFSSRKNNVFNTISNENINEENKK